MLDAVQAGTCTRFCAEGLPLPSCAAAPGPPAAAAGPSGAFGNSHFSGVSSYLQSAALAPASAPGSAPGPYVLSSLYGTPAPFLNPGSSSGDQAKAQAAALSALLSQV